MTVKVTFEAEDPRELAWMLGEVVQQPERDVPKFDPDEEEIPFRQQLRANLLPAEVDKLSRGVEELIGRVGDLETTMLVEKADHECEPADLYWSVDFEEAQRVALLTGVMWRKPRIGQLHNRVDVRVTFCHHCHKLMVEVKEHQDEEQEEIKNKEPCTQHEFDENCTCIHCGYYNE